MSCKLGAGCYLSAVTAELRVPHVVLTECLYEPHHRVPKHEHEWLHFGFLLRGGFRETHSGGEQDCTPSALIFHPVGDVHADRFGPSGGRCFNLEIDPYWEALRPLPAVGWTDLQGGSIVASRIYTEFCRPDPLTPLAVHGLLLSLAATLGRHSLRPEPRIPGWLKRVKDALDSNPLANHSLASLASLAKVHEVHLCREFKRHFGAAISDYVRRRRIELAATRLRAGKVSIGELAHELGFCDQAHFSKTFRRVMGVSPSEFRQRR